MLLLYIPSFGKSDKPRPIDWLGFVWMAIGLGALQMMLSLGDQDGWLSSRFIIILTLLAGMGILLFVLRSLNVSHPLVNLRLLKDRSLTLGSAGIGLFGLVLYPKNSSYPY